jgi:hypothetical protein
MDLLRNLFGNLTSGIIRLAITAGILFLAYLFIVKPVLDTTNEALKSSGLDQIGKSLEGMSTTIKREVHRSFEATKPGTRRRRLIHCVKRAHGDVHKVERCARRF